MRRMIVIRARVAHPLALSLLLATSAIPVACQRTSSARVDVINATDGPIDVTRGSSPYLDWCAPWTDRSGGSLFPRLQLGAGDAVTFADSTGFDDPEEFVAARRTGTTEGEWAKIPTNSILLPPAFHRQASIVAVDRHGQLSFEIWPHHRVAGWQNAQREARTGQEGQPHSVRGGCPLSPS